MAEDISVLGIAVETRGVKEGSDALDKLALSGAGAEKATALLATETKKTSSVIAGLAKDYQSAGDSISDALKKLRIRDSSAIAKEANEIRNALNQIKATGSLDDITRASIAAKAAMSSLRTEFDGIARMPKLNPIPDLAPHIAGMNKLGMSANATAAAMRNVPAQFTDIITSLQGGQAPLTVLMQQGGQLKDMFGGVGNAAKAIGGYALGLVNPFTVAAAAAAALGVAYYQGSGEAQAFTSSLILSGNAAGVTAGQLMDMAKSLSESSGATRGSIAETLNEIASSGKISSAVLAQVGKAATDMQKAGGAAASDTVKEFEAIGVSPVAAILKLNEKYHFLTAAVYEQIKALQDQGRETDAANLAQTTYANTLEGRIPGMVSNLGSVERAWKSIVGGAKSAWDAMLNIGREGGLEEQLAKAKKYAENLARSGDSNTPEGERSNSQAQQAIKAIEEKIKKQGQLTDAEVETNKAREAGLKWSISSAKYLDDDAKKRAEILRVTNEMTAAGVSQSEQAKILAKIEESYSTKKSASNKALREDYSELFSRQEQEARNRKDAEKELDSLAKANEAYAKSIEAIYAPLEKEAGSIELQLQNYGLTRAEIEATTIARLEENRVILSGQEGMGELVANLDREIAARKRIKEASEGIDSKKSADEQIKASKHAAEKAAEDWKKTSDKIGDSITDALMRGFESGKGFAETLRDTVVNMFNTMVLQPVIKATVVGGLSALGMGPATAADGSDIGSLGNLASTGNSLFNIGSTIANGAGALPMTTTIAEGVGALGGDSIGTLMSLNPQWGVSTAALGTSIGTAAGTAFATTATGAAVSTTTAAGVAAASAGSSVAAGGAATAGLAAVPVAGWVALAAIAAYSIFGGKDAGPKYEGNYFGVLDNAGGSKSQQYATWWSHGTGYSGDSADGQLAQMAPSLTTAINGLVTSLGGTAAGIGVNYGFNHDDSGGANDQISTVVSDSKGNIAYENSYSMDSGGYKDALALEMQRMTLGAIKAADGIKPIFKELVDGIDLTVASAETITKAISDLQGIVTLRAAFDNLNLDADDLSLSLISASGGVSALSTKLESYYSTYFTEAEKTQNLADSLTKSFAAMGMEMPASKAAFRAVVEGLDLTTNAGRATFAAMMDLAPSFATVATAAASASAAMTSTLDKAVKAAAMASVDADYSALERAVSAQKAALQTAYESQAAINQSAIDASTAIRDNLSSLADTLKSAVGTITADPDANLLATRSAAQATLNSAYTASQSGQSMAPFADSIKSAIDSLSKPSDQVYSTFEDYATAQGQANATLSALATASGDQLSVAELTLKALKNSAESAEKQYSAQVAYLDQVLSDASAQINELKGINTSVVSVAAAISNLKSSMATASAVIAPAAGGASSGSSASTASSAAVSSLYSTLLGREADAAGAAYWSAAIASGMSVADAAKAIMSGNEYKNSHAGGLERVPFDGYKATLHAGEAVVDAQSTRAISRYFGGSAGMSNNTARLELLVEKLTEEVNLLRYEARATATNTNKTAKTLEKFDIDGMPAERIAA